MTTTLSRIRVPYNYLDRQFGKAETDEILDDLRALVETGEFTIGLPHDVTDRVFVVRRVFRMNDALTSHPEWKWQRDGWVMVDRSTGRVSNLSLPDFDP